MPDGFQYKRLTVHLVAEAQRHERIISEQAAQIESLTNRIVQIEKKLG